MLTGKFTWEYAGWRERPRKQANPSRINAKRDPCRTLLRICKVQEIIHSSVLVTFLTWRRFYAIPVLDVTLSW
jgi:hypothetical protein